MITNNFKNWLATLLQSYQYSNPTANGYGMLPAKNVSGDTRYLLSYTSATFPVVATTTPTLGATSAGISVGTDSTAASVNDWNLGATITSGIALQTTQIVQGLDNGNPYVEFRITVTNNTNASITINEIGYKQPLYSRSEQGTSGSVNPYMVFLFDRTLLTTPLTVGAGMSGVINYRLTTEI